MSLITCNRCNTPKAPDEFKKDRRRPGGRTRTCSECDRKAQRQQHADNAPAERERLRNWRRQNKTRHQANKKRWAQENPDKIHAMGIKRNFGLSGTEYAEMLARQDGVCAICQQPETLERDGRVLPLAVDHNHETGEIRGLLCCRCNLMIGKSQDSPERLRAAADYLEKSLCH